MIAAGRYSLPDSPAHEGTASELEEGELPQDDIADGAVSVGTMEKPALENRHQVDVLLYAA